jgi:hypothetical protein
MSLYRRKPVVLYSVAWYRRLGLEAKLVLDAVVCGDSGPTPGLTPADSLSIASTAGLTVEQVEAGMAELMAAGRIEVDTENRLVRLPWLPRMLSTSSFKMLLAWWNAWRNLPDSPLKYDHVTSLHDGADMTGKNMPATWEKTFGAISNTHTDTYRDTHTDTNQAEKKSSSSRKAGAGAQESFAAVAASPPKSKGGKRRSKQADPLPHPIGVYLATIGEASKGKVVVDPFDDRLATPLTATARTIPNLDDWRLVGEHIAAGAHDWMKTPAGLSWIASAGKLTDAVGQARKWDADGRRPINGKANGNGARGPITPMQPALVGGRQDL